MNELQQVFKNYYFLFIYSAALRINVVPSNHKGSPEGRQVAQIVVEGCRPHLGYPAGRWVLGSLDTIAKSVVKLAAQVAAGKVSESLAKKTMQELKDEHLPDVLCQTPSSSSSAPAPHRISSPPPQRLFQNQKHSHYFNNYLHKPCLNQDTRSNHITHTPV